MKAGNLSHTVSQVFNSWRKDHTLEAELRDVFDTRWYLASNPDVASSEIDPFEHFLAYGYRENRSPNAVFNPDWYLKTYPDVAEYQVHPLMHYLKYGYREGRSPHPLFDGDWYLNQYPDVRRALLNPLAHYVKYGVAEQRRPSVWFDPSWYLLQTADANAKENPVGHFLSVTTASKLSPIPLFDSEWYIEQYPDIKTFNPLMHYIFYGAKEGRNPNILFDAKFYISHAGDEAKHNPLLHYITVGAAKGLSFHPMFDVDWYRQRYPDFLRTLLDPLSHYYRIGCHEGRSPHSSFNAMWYVAQPHARDIALKDAFLHYLTVGLLHGYPGKEPQASVTHTPSTTPAAENIPDQKNLNSPKPTIMLVIGKTDEEIDLHIYELGKTISSENNILILKCPNRDDHIVEIHDPKMRLPLRFNVIHEQENIIEHLQMFNLQLASIHCTAAEFVAFKGLNQTLKLPYDVTLYDFGLFGCEKHPSLENNDVSDIKRCGNAEVFASDATLRGMIEGAKRVFVPSNYMLQRVRSATSIANVIFAPRLNGLPKQNLDIPHLRPGQVLNVGVLWNRHDRSQLNTISDVGRLITKKNAPVRIILAGNSAFNSSSCSDLPITSIGDYTRGQLSEVLKQNRVHLLWYPTKILEAFSLTLSEGLSTGLPLLASDVGAYPEQVAERPWSFVTCWRNTPDEWLKNLLAIRNSLLTRSFENISGLTTE